MTRRIRPEEVLRHLQVDAERLLRTLRSEGLFEAEQIDEEQAEELRVATLLIEELDVNAAGVTVALHLRRRMRALESRMRLLIEEVERRRSG